MRITQHNRFRPAAACSDLVLSATVKTRCAAQDLGVRLVPPDPRNAGRQRTGAANIHDETGAQAAEYAMLSGVGVAIAATCIAVIRRGDVIKTLMVALVEVLVSFVQSWFAG